MKRKACKMCKLIVEDSCPTHGEAHLTESWKGRLFLADIEHSFIAEKLAAKTKGEYAIKV